MGLTTLKLWKQVSIVYILLFGRDRGKGNAMDIALKEMNALLAIIVSYKVIQQKKISLNMSIVRPHRTSCTK